MSKVKETAEVFNWRITLQYPRIFRADSKVLFCLAFHTEIEDRHIFQIKQHMITAKP